jgi:hypothetical protein
MPDLFRDTSPQADAIQLQILRQMPPARRGYLATSLSRTVLRSSRQGIARRTPTFTPQQIVAASIAINYGAPWAARVQPRLASSEDPMLDPLLHTALTPVIDLFDQLGIRYHLGGSLASSIHGVPRATLDADVVAFMGTQHIPLLVQALQATFYLSETEMREALAQPEGFPSFNLIHLTMGVKIDVFVPPATPYAESRMARALPAAFEEDPQARRFYVASAEDMILTKLAWYAAGNRTSDRQWADIQGMLHVQRDLLDHSYLTQWAPALGVADLLDEAWTAAGL